MNALVQGAPVSALANPPIPLNITIIEADGGFVLNVGYSQQMVIARDIDEVLTIVRRKLEERN